MKTAALLLALAASAADAACSRALSVGVSDLGYSAFLRDERVQGIVPDLMAELERRSDCRLLLRWAPRARVLVDFERGELDLLTSARRSPERDRSGHFLPYAYTRLDLVAASPQAPQSLQAFGGRPGDKLGIVRGVRMGEAMEELVAGLLATRQAEYSPDFANLAAKLAAGRIQGAIIPNVIHLKLRRDGLLPAPSVIIELPEDSPDTIGLYVSRALVPQADVQELQRHLEQLRREGWIEQLYARYIGSAEARRLFRSEAR